MRTRITYSVQWITTKLNGKGIESRLGRDFPHPSRPALGPHPAFYTTGNESFSKRKSDREVALNTHPSTAEVKEKKEYSDTSTPLLCLHGLLYDERYLWRILNARTRTTLQIVGPGTGYDLAARNRIHVTSCNRTAAIQLVAKHCSILSTPVGVGLKWSLILQLELEQGYRCSTSTLQWASEGTHE